MLGAVKNYFAEFKVLKTANREFWLINAIQFFDGLAYFSMITIITLYLTSNAGLSDVESGTWVGIFTLLISIFVMAVGSICDSIGIKHSYYIGFGLLLFSRLGLGVSPLFLEGSALKITAEVLLIVMAFGTSMILPVTNTGLRRFTTKENRATGFNMYYLIMNVGAIGGGWVVSLFRDHFGAVSGNLAILDFGVAMAVITFIISVIMDEHNYADESERVEKTEEKRSPLKIFLEVWGEKPFRKLMLFLVLTIGVRLVFTHQFLVMPKYYTRAVYNDFDLGQVNMINPTIIVIGLILVIPIINKFDTVKLIIAGMAISAFSLLPMALPLRWFLYLPFIHNYNQALWFVILTQIVIFAFGELTFSPRFTEYIASIAPKDKVGSYMGLSALPMFIAKPVNGFISGILIAKFCYPGIRAKLDIGDVTYWNSPTFMWLVYFILAATSPLAVIALKNYLTKKDDDEPEEAVPEKVEEAVSDRAEELMEDGTTV